MSSSRSPGTLMSDTIQHRIAGVEGMAQDNVSLSVNGAYKRYDKTSPFVLNNFCMSVEHNTIYALLGASGCGKTTLLSCIVDKLPLDAGTIHLSITSKRYLGFMPQQLALYHEFSIREMFQYFGILYSMSQREIDHQLDTLMQILSLPDPNSLCGQVSGGQQRRISVAVTMMHSPLLLILDEPTAGLDPLISDTIWQHLRTLSATGVGLMRNGVILEENSPNNLLDKYKAESLEQVFLMLSEQQHMASKYETNNNESVNLVLKPEKQEPVPPLYHEDVKSVSKDHIRCQMYKYFNWMKRNILIALFVILLPGVSVMLFNFAFQNLPQLSLAVINEDSNCTSAIPMGCDENQTDLSCHYLSILSDRRWHWDLHIADDLEAARQNLYKSDKFHGVLRIPRNFSIGLVTKLIQGRSIEESLLASSFIDAEINRGDFVRSHQMEDGLLHSFQLFFKEFIKSCNLDERLSRLPPINFAEPIFGKKEPEFVQYISSGLIIQISFCFPVLFSVSSLTAEKLLGLMERSLVAGLTILEVVLAHSCVCFLMVITQSTVAMLSQYWLWAHPFHGSIALGFALLMSEGICGTMLGFLVALMAKTYIPGTMTVGTLNSVVLLFCGYLWPLEGMHPLARPFSYLLPPTTGIQALRAIIWKNYSISHPEVMAGFVPPFVWTVLFLLNMIYYVRRNHM
ncbi:hypothetical protein M8J76_012948 [Diaphorina citri]|nr:hypothetical protein M8J75_014150 [Diaphorina citri]KAI5719649.1 hypothetical protein M8J76_012948 [Diaphorina citri]